MLRRFHRWVGLVLALPFAIQALTGLVLLLLPRFEVGRPQVAGDGDVIAADVQIAGARAAAPSGSVALDYAPPRWHGDSAVVGFGPPHTHHPALSVAVDPANGHVLRVTSHALFMAAHHLHTDLFLVPYGQAATTVMGLVLTLMALTGVALWCPAPALFASVRWARAIVPSRDARGYRRLRELHRIAGFWTALLLGFMGASGAVLTLGHDDHGAGHRGGAHRIAGSHEGGARGDPGAISEPVATVLARLRDMRPDAVVQDVSLGPAGPLRLRVVLPERGSRDPVMIDAATRFLAVPSVEPRRFRDVLRADARLLHTASVVEPAWIGVVWTVLVALAGVSLFGMSITGAWMTVRRKGRKNVDAAGVTVQGVVSAVSRSGG